MNPWSCLSSGHRMDSLSQVGNSQLMISFPIFPGEEMAHKIATGLKVPGLATVSNTSRGVYYVQRVLF